MTHKVKAPLFAFVLSLILSLGAGHSKFKHSYANPEKMLLKNIALDLIIDFDKKVLKGTATLTVKRLQGTQLWLDTNMLKIKSITGDLKSWEKKPDPEISQKGFGEPLLIETKDQDNLKFLIEYETHPSAPGLVWLDAHQTRSKEPFMFSVNEPIGARSWFPTQDTPAVRSTFRANLKIIANNRLSKKPLMALIAGENNPVQANNSMSYENLQSVLAPIPSYLFAIAAGNFIYRNLSDTIGFYADNKQSLDDAMSGLKDTPKYFAELKRLLGDTPWPSQNFLFLSPPQDFAGMENPMLIYFNEKLLDKNGSSNYIAAHELAHMWTGNIVTNKEWNDFWINEAWSTYFEDRLLEAIHGKEYSDANARITYQDLIDGEKKRLASAYELPSQPTRMHKANAESTHPSELIDFSIYPKGSSMLRHIEKIITREQFDTYAQNYVKDFRFIPITTDMFIKYSVEKLGAIRPEIKWKAYLRDWIYNPGMKPNASFYNTPEIPIPKES